MEEDTIKAETSSSVQKPNDEITKEIVTEKVLAGIDSSDIASENQARSYSDIMDGSVYIEDLKARIISGVENLDRGFEANDDDRLNVENLVQQLEEEAGPVILLKNIERYVNEKTVTEPSIAGSESSRPRDSWYKSLSTLEGRWKLIYSSGFIGGNLGGRRPGPPKDLLPIKLGDVFQDIDIYSKKLDNVVNLSLGMSVASLPGFENVGRPSVTATLVHSFEILGASTIEIVFEDTVLKFQGGIAGWLDSVPDFNLPGLPDTLREIGLPSRRATFDIAYLDHQMRVTRGDLGELRIFIKEAF